MLTSLYPISFLIALGALTSWFYFQEDDQRSNLMRKIFYSAITLFGVSFLLNKGEWAFKFLMLGREMLILLVVPLFLSFFRKNKWAFLAMLFAVLGGMEYFYFESLKTTYSNTAELADVNNPGLDTNGELLVEILDGHDVTEVEALWDKYSIIPTLAFSPKDKESTDLDDYYLVNIPQKFEGDLQEVKKEIEKNKLVEWVEYNEQYSLSPLESILQRSLPKLNKKFGLNDPGLEHLWGFEEMNVVELYGVLKNHKPVKKALIAILDTGVDAGHEDIQANFYSIQSKYDSDPAGHGTHCAGIAAAVSNNNIGLASFSQTNEYVQVSSIKVLTSGGFGTQKMIIDGILEAADAGADVISLSLGGVSNDLSQRAYKKAVGYANQKGSIVVVAAGNSNRNAKDFGPANTPGVIAVSAVDTMLNRANFSNFVNDLDMGIAAPGVAIFSTFPNNQYRTFNGTSMATPYVAGLLGLMRSLKPDLTTKAAYSILEKTGRLTNQTSETGKMIQPGAAVKALVEGS